MNFTAPKAHNILPEKVFFLLGPVFGLLYLFFTPPLQVPDEPAHFLRAWQISEGQFFAVKKDNRIGGEVPLSLEKMSHPFWLSIFPGTPVNFDTLTRVNQIRINPDVVKFKDFNNTALYSPLCYIPQALGILIFRLFDAPPLTIFYAGRLAALILWLIAMYHAIRIIPLMKWMCVALALLPMSLYTNMSMSADVMTNAFAWLFTAYIVRCAFTKRHITRREILNLALLALMLVSLKVIYAAMLALLFLIPFTGYNNRRHAIITLCCIVVPSILLALFWNNQTRDAYITYENYNTVFRDDLSLVQGADMSSQAKYILSHGNYFTDVFFRSVSFAFPMYSKGFIGTFGWLSLELPVMLIVFAYLYLFYMALTDRSGDANLSLRQKLIIAFTFCLLFFLVFLSQHLLWDPVGWPVISNIQGRYLIPFAPLLFFVWQNRRFRVSNFPILVFCSTVLSLYSIQILYQKFYGAS